MEQRKPKRDFKKGISLEDNRRRREENSIKLRKDSKHEGLAKRRNYTIDENSQLQAPSSDDLSILFSGLLKNDLTEQTNSLRGIRKALSAEKNPPVRQCIEMGLVPLLVGFLSSSHFEQQFEAAWALTNIASTDHTRCVVENLAVPPLVSLLMSSNPDIREQCAWCLGNIAGDGPEMRDYILSSNALNPLLLNITQPSSLSILRNSVWSLSNLCRGKPQPCPDSIAPALPVLGQIIRSEVDVESVVDATWAISYLSDGDDSRIQSVLDLSILPNLVKMISSNNTSMIIPALRAIGNIVSGSDNQTQAVIEAGSLPALSSLLLHSKKSIRKEACWVLSNIAAGTQSQLNSIFQTPELISRVIRQLGTAIEWDVRKEAAWVISNMITSSPQARLLHLLELGVIAPLCELLNTGDSRIILITLDAIETMLKLKGHVDSVSHLIEESGGLDLLEKLQEHENVKVYERAVGILERYFAAEEEDSENVSPAVSNNVFVFGSNDILKAKTPNNQQFERSTATFSF